jgi:hypothetical protein
MAGVDYVERVEWYAVDGQKRGDYMNRYEKVGRLIHGLLGNQDYIFHVILMQQL